jgi:hypothetical protein
MQHATLASGLFRWREQVWELRRQQGILEKVASRIRNAAVCMALARWGERAKEVHRQRTEEMQKWGGGRQQTLQNLNFLHDVQRLKNCAELHPVWRECACERVCLGHGFLANPSSFVLKIDVTIMVDLFLNA